MVECPKCSGGLIETSMDLDVYIKCEKVGTVENVKVYSCDTCDYDGFLLKVEVTTEGIYLGGE